jgi:prevent-host-death family protein
VKGHPPTSRDISMPLGLDSDRTEPYSSRMKPVRKGAEEARNQLPDLLDAAANGRSTIITKHGKPVAALVPVETLAAARKQAPLVPLMGSGRGLWGKDSTQTVRDIREEWDR